jgi:hypothetical protein
VRRPAPNSDMAGIRRVPLACTRPQRGLRHQPITHLIVRPLF